ncbi:DUF3742 family protein [Burkholderia sp. Bp9012]|uniref:DUF3742 family protein n=1 Tax=Burkholderia sp. Bp9012 TaxID=2184562 RepID=UPI000F5B5FF5|nr:DUF3742 family protein [Burkholderia sp. Bp9012]RQR79142.1 DUF3742 family protein [Burkholderia sp. Bp9012]
MTTTTHHHPWAQRAGQIAGRACRWYARREQQLLGTLIAQGMPARVASSALWVVKLAALGVLLYVAFWLTLLLAFAIAGAWVARNTDWEEERPTEWRNGVAGYGLYTSDGYRIDPHDPEDEEA